MLDENQGSMPPSKSARPFDLLGASGFAGRQTVAYLAGHPQDKALGLDSTDADSFRALLCESALALALPLDELPWAPARWGANPWQWFGRLRVQRLRHADMKLQVEPAKC